MRIDDIRVPSASFGPLTRTMLSDYAQASGDNNPLHLDDATARLAGHREVIGQGMLSMAFVARWVTTWCSINELQSLSSRFTAPIPLGSRLTCQGRVSDLQPGSATVAYTVAIDMTDVLAIAGTAVVDPEVIERLENRRHPQPSAGPS
jgi:acyl dehydratase